MSPEEIHNIFGRRVLRERTARGWSVREMAAKSGLSASTISRAENSREIWLSAALALAAALDMTLDRLFTEPDCGHCDGKPPAGFVCPDCGRLGAA